MNHYEEEIENVNIGYTGDNKILDVEIDYPRNNTIDTIQIGMCDVRATDDIRVTYDFDRDGWIIFQPKDVYTEKGNSVTVKEEWIESAFLPAWKFENEGEV